jgi:hypothetical protein
MLPLENERVLAKTAEWDDPIGNERVLLAQMPIAIRDVGVLEHDEIVRMRLPIGDRTRKQKIPSLHKERSTAEKTD